MYINTDCKNFIPKDFIILNFYGKDTCFAWNENKFVCFPYWYKISTEKLKVLKAPASIKNIRGFNKRVFVLCLPTGIYKFTDNLEFANLSKNGIELGSDFSEVLVSNNGMIILEDKKLISNRNLFSISSICNPHVLTLNYENTDTNFLNMFLPDNYNNNINLSFISNDNQLFKMFNQIIHAVYSCDYLIKDIKPVQKNDKIIGILLQTDSKVVIFIHSLNNKLKHDKIFLQSYARTVNAVVDINNENELVIIHSDSVRTYYNRKILNRDLVHEVRIEQKNYESLRLYNSKFLIYLNSSKELLQVHIALLRNSKNQSINDYVKLESNVLKGSETKIEIICDKTTELRKLGDQMIEKENRLKRINLFVDKQNIKFHPDDIVKRMLNQISLVSNFKRILPENSTLVKMLKSKGKTIFSMKKVKNYDTVIEMPICTSNLSSKLNITTNLITYKNDNGIWCLIKNYIQNPILSKREELYLATNKLQFVKYKLIVLQNLIKANNLSLEMISQIKRDIRQEIKTE